MDDEAWDGTPGEVVDSSGLGNHGYAGDQVTIATDGVSGYRAVFNGQQPITVPDSESLHVTTGLTVSAWAMADGFRAGYWPGVVAKRYSDSQNVVFDMYFDGNTGDTDVEMGIDVDSLDNHFHSATRFVPNRWYHLALVFDGTLQQAERVRFYVDGVLDVVASENSATLPVYEEDITIGLLPNGGSLLEGSVDEVAIWNRALSADEVALVSDGAAIL
jgi:hypothetical protein